MNVQLFEVLYSAAGSDNKEIYDILSATPTHNLTGKEKKCLADLLESFDINQKFLPLDVLKRNYGEYATVVKDAVDFNFTLQKILNDRGLDDRKQNLIAAVDEAESIDELNYNCGKVLEKRTSTSRNLSRPTDLRKTYKASGSDTGGFILGVPEIDMITGGFQPGLTFVCAGFVSHGKSTLLP